VGRQQLLDSTLKHVREHGVGNQSLRELADSIGTSHRMLLYHFGSREGLLAAIIGANEDDERQRAAKFARDGVSVPESLRSSWRRLRNPRRASEERLFFELAAMAMYERPGTEGVAAEMVDHWVKSSTEPAMTRLDIAVVRGLLLDYLLTGDRKGTDDAFERYVELRC
jgi:AcrR family transcriptional regulator